MKKRIVVFAIAIIIIIIIGALIYASLVYDQQKNGNFATTISGLWSALATAAVGLIAFWQSAKYKKISDETTDAMLMPDIFQTIAFSDEFAAPFEQARPFVKGRLDITEGYKVSKPIHLSFVKGPILNLTAKEIRNETKVLTFIQGDTVSLRDEAISFNLVLEVPDKWLADRTCLSVILAYESIYGTKYEKTILLSFNPDTMTVDTITFEKAKRVV